MPIKNLGIQIKGYIERFIVQGHKEREREYLVNISRTIRYRSVHLMVSLTAAINFKIQSQDVTKAYIRGHDLKRAVYVKPTPDFDLPPNHFLKVLKPLYGQTEAEYA